MVFQRAVSIGTVSRGQARRGTFALEPIEALPRLAERIGGLAARALETNPFFLPEFLEPAMQALGKKRLRLAIFSDRDDLHFFAPVVAPGGQLFGARSFSVWAHPYAPLGTPLIDAETAPQVTDALFAHMRTSGRTLLSVPHLPLNGSAAGALRAAAERSGFWTVADRQMRPILYPDVATGMAAFDQMVNQKRRRELDRQLRRLCETGAVSFMSARSAGEIESAFGMFTALEGAGWKGRRGTALNKGRACYEFARVAITRMAQKGLGAIDVMRARRSTDRGAHPLRPCRHVDPLEGGLRRGIRGLLAGQAADVRRDAALARRQEHKARRPDLRGRQPADAARSGPTASLTERWF